MSSNLLMFVNPELAKEYSAKNKRPLGEVTVSMGWKAIWQCAKCSYEWEAQVASRSKNYVISKSRGCPNCAGKVANESTSLVSLFPDIAKYYHRELNSKPVEEIVAGSHDDMWWFCDKGHEYKSSAMNKTRQSDGCPYCSGRYASPGNNLAEDNSLLAKEFDLKKNSPLTPYDVTPRSAKSFFWLCPNNHSYNARLSDRNGPKNTGCAECRSLAFVAPHLLKELDPDKNKDVDPSKVYVGSSWIKLWWKCSEGHSWQASVSSRSNKRKPTGCPDCVRSQTSKVEDVLREKLVSGGIISNIAPGQNASLPIAWRKNKKLRVDILGSYKGRNIVFEYDGWYWHSDQPSGGGNSSFLRDLAKTQALLSHDCIVVRIREERYDVCLVKLGIKHENYIEVSYNYLREQKFTDDFLENIYQKLEQMDV